MELYNRYEIAPLLFAYLKERCLQATVNLFMFFYLVNSEINDWERKEKGHAELPSRLSVLQDGQGDGVVALLLFQGIKHLPTQ